jgi:non-ribosomal peptide synthetase component E (peptide arylation enzyme)
MLEQKLAEIAQKYPNKTAIVEDRSKITYEKL